MNNFIECLYVIEKCHLLIKGFVKIISIKARFKRRTSHVPNQMLIRKIFCSNSFALDSAHEEFDV